MTLRNCAAHNSDVQLLNTTQFFIQSILNDNALILLFHGNINRASRSLFRDTFDFKNNGTYVIKIFIGTYWGNNSHTDKK